MADRPAPVNTVRPGDKARSLDVGDVPDALRQRYLTESGRMGAGLAFYADATTLVPSFRDRGGQLVATRSDPPTIRDLVGIAQHRGWTQVRVEGAQGFRREAWLAGRTAGPEVDGYRPSERDEQALARRRQPERQRQPSPQPEAERNRKSRAPTPAERMRIVEGVLRARVASPASQSRILAAARSRMATLLDRTPGVERSREYRRATVEVERRR